MKMQFALTLILTFGSLASAQVNGYTLNLHCDKSETPETCAPKSENAIRALGCEVQTAATACTFSLVEDPNDPLKTIQGETPYCEVTSVNCSQPRLGNFGGESCISGRKVEMAKADKVHNGYWFGVFGSYSRTICLE